MVNEKVQFNKLSIYLIKEDYCEHGDILKNIDELPKREIEGIGVFYYGDSHKFEPSWIKSFFGTILDDDLGIFNASAKAILLVEVQVDERTKRTFVISFGYGWVLLTPGVYEERFGLKATLNIIDPSSLRRIDKKNMSTVPKDMTEQLSRNGVASDFGINIEQDLIQAVSGMSKEEGFGKRVTGKTSFSCSTRVNIENIKEFLITCFNKYKSDEYKQHFEWVDQYVDIKDPKIIVKLNNELLKNIKNQKFDKTWMAVPDIVEWDEVRGFIYEGMKADDAEDDISLTDFISSLPQAEQDTLDIPILKKKKVYSILATNDQIRHRWKSYDCIYCEIDSVDRTYLLNNGKWYEVDNAFVNQVNSDYRALISAQTTLTLPAYDHDNEDEYNNDAAMKNDDFCCMHCKPIMVGGGRGRVGEFCDIYTKSKKIIHVKKYGGSVVLGHLFDQGIVSGQLFVGDKTFRGKVNEILPETHRISDPISRPNNGEYEIIFGIISSYPSELEIPFFSKVTLRDAKQRLEAYGYMVSLQKIDAKTKATKNFRGSS